VDVVLVRWPAETEHREHLAREGRPRLLLLDVGVLPPVVEDPLEDWVRITGPDAEVRARVNTLALRARVRAATQPTLDDDGVIRHNGSWISLAPVGARMAKVLLERLGSVVSRERLAEAAWPDGAPGDHALDVHVLRLRRRLDHVGLAIRTVRARGFVLEPYPRDVAADE
jgi:hypothetical protein